jgi:FixJ family two-component response regulator
MNSRYACTATGLPAAAEVPTVIVVDDDASVRETLASLIQSAGWQPLAIASAEEFMACPRPIAASCLLTELNLPGSSGLELQREIADWRQTPVIFMSRDADVPSTVKAMKRGAFEFLTKPLEPIVLLKVIDDALECSRAAWLQAARLRVIEQRYELLSRREREVMSLVVAGQLNKQVGGALGISEITVKAHRGNMMRKMEARSFAHLMNMATNLSVIAEA